MTIEELESIEREEEVSFFFNWGKKTIGVKGKPTAIDRAFERIAAHRDEVAELLRARQPAPEEPIIVRELAISIPSLATQRENYIKWFMQRSTYFHPNEAQLDRMFAAVEEGDEVIPDFAHSFTVRKPNGLLVSVDRKGRVTEPSPYSPAVLEQKQKRARGSES